MDDQSSSKLGREAEASPDGPVGRFLVEGYCPTDIQPVITSASHPGHRRLFGRWFKEGVGSDCSVVGGEWQVKNAMALDMCG